MLQFIAGMALAAQCAAPQNPSQVQVETERASLIRVREFRGNFQQHVQELSNVRREFTLGESQQPVIIGIYPDDPDAVGIENVRWQLGARVDSQGENESADQFFHRIEQTQPQRRNFDARLLQPGQAAVLRSTIRASRDAGLEMLRWLACSDYAPAGPTRMEYLTPSGGLDSPVRIVVPVVPRVWTGPN